MPGQALETLSADVHLTHLTYSHHLSLPPLPSSLFIPPVLPHTYSLLCFLDILASLFLILLLYAAFVLRIPAFPTLLIAMGQSHSRDAVGPSRPNRDLSLAPTRPIVNPASNVPSAGGVSISSPEPRSSISNSLRLRPPRLSSLGRLSSTTGSAESSQSNTASPAQQRRSRLVRARSSFSTSIPNFLNRYARPSNREFSDETHRLNEDPPAPENYPRLSPLQSNDDPGYQIPQLEVPRAELDISFDEFTSDTDPPSPQPSRREVGRASSFISERMSALRPDRSLRNMTNSLRRRRSPLRREEDQAAMLSRLLSVAAAATAASLMGDANIPSSEVRGSATGDSDDGSFSGFLQSLQNGRIASALRERSNEAIDDPEGDGSTLNFFRMFRFGVTNNNRQGSVQARNERPRSGGLEPAVGQTSRDGSNGESGQNNQSGQNGVEEGTDERLVPIIIVGISSIHPGSGSSQEDNIPPFLDALSSIPANFSAPGETTIDGVLRQPQTSTRFSHRRRASLGGMNTSQSNYDSQRHQRSPERSRPWSTISDSPSGPRPPPSTPASNNLSALSSGNTTPTFSSTFASAAPSRRESFVRRNRGTAIEPSAETVTAQPRTARQRRLSESDFTPFTPGGPRRNGVVEPDHTPGEGARSWIIYVLGGSYPENHPILTTPSLFTDSPTYEDMLLLSGLLGPAKPPVASEADVAAAPGLFKIALSSSGLVALEADGEESIKIALGARCLVCLSEFELDEEVRKLVKCEHYFHQECIDKVR